MQYEIAGVYDRSWALNGDGPAGYGNGNGESPNRKFGDGDLIGTGHGGGYTSVSAVVFAPCPVGIRMASLCGLDLEALAYYHAMGEPCIS